jgi:hypothetical protein
LLGTIETLFKLSVKLLLYVTPEMDHAFHQLKSALCTAAILARPQFSMPFNMTTDASKLCLGALLSQQNPEGKVVIHFASKRLSPRESRLIAAEREALASICACELFRRFFWKTIITLSHTRVVENQLGNWVHGHRNCRSSISTSSTGREHVLLTSVTSVLFPDNHLELMKNWIFR